MDIDNGVGIDYGSGGAEGEKLGHCKSIRNLKKKETAKSQSSVKIKMQWFPLQVHQCSEF